MIDMHCHILPGVDDGASSWEETLDMARCAVSDGIRVIVCTPHMNAEADFSDKLAEHERLLKKARLRLAEENINLQLFGGAEWMLTPNLPEALSEKGRLAGSRAFLFELSPFMIPSAAERFVAETVCLGLCPVLAHPERHPWMHEKNCTDLKSLVSAGCILQLTAASFTGECGKHARRIGEILARMYSGAVVLATDAHDPHMRKPLLREGYKALEKLRPGMAESVLLTLRNILYPDGDERYGTTC